ncbi:MAG: hypothetical protein JNM43_18260 [Planctomycetaceae bacterium]|nr:hypothetical protein [Planctomycetaceae bacterium]
MTDDCEIITVLNVLPRAHSQLPSEGTTVNHFIRRPSRLILSFCSLILLWPQSEVAAQEQKINHSLLVLGQRTAIISEQDEVTWEYDGGSRDGFVLPNGNVLLVYRDRAVEVQPDKTVVWSRKLSAENSELGTVQRLYNGNTLVTELGNVPRLLEIKPDGSLQHSMPLQPETNNAHMQTRMARQLRNGNYLVPHLLAFAVKEYTPDGNVIQVIRTDLEELGGRPQENWPFTAIRLDNGNTVISLTHGNKVIEVDGQGKVIWKVTNEDVGGVFKDPCGAQRLANGNTVVGSHGASSGIFLVEVNRDRKIVWSSQHPAATAVHSFQILTTNGVPEPGMPQK